jgi:hypothetical protein
MANLMAKAAAILEHAEISLRSLISEAAVKGEYEVVGKLAQLSRDLRLLAGTPDVGDSVVKEHPPLIKKKGRKDDAISLPLKSRRMSEKHTRKHSSETRPETTTYPRFCRESEFLVKIGWSKQTASEYEHRISFDGLKVVAEFIDGVREEEFPITAERIVSELGKTQNEIVLGYQVYVAIAWLRSTKILEVSGRQGYFRTNTGSIVDRIVQMWEQLATCRSMRT